MAPSTEDRVSIRTPDAFTLAGQLREVEDAEKVAVLCHGINSNKQEYLDVFPKLAERLAAVGISSLRFDFRGHGDSSGEAVDFNITGQMIDLKAVIAWIRSRYGGRREPDLAYVGVSFGGPPGIFLSGSGKTFSSISLIAPVLSYSQTFLSPRTEWARASFNEKSLEHARNFGYLLLDNEFVVGVRLIEEMELLHPEVSIGSIGQDVLLFHGDADTMVPCEVSKSVGERFPNIDLRVLEGVGHGLYISGDDDGITPETAEIQDTVLGSIVDSISRNFREHHDRFTDVTVDKSR